MIAPPRAIWLRPLPLLVLASVLYLALPYPIFFAGWLRIGWALAATALLLVGVGTALYGYGRQFRTEDTALSLSPFLSRKALVLVILLAAALTVVAGIGGLGVQTGDWRKNNALFQDLIVKDWPVSYAYLGQPVVLVYYLAFFLPAAVVGKLGGWLAGNLALALWGFGGLLLALLWVVRLARRPVGRTLALFVVLSGLDVIGYFLLHDFRVDLADPGTPFGLLVENLNVWNTAWQYGSSMTVLFWVPNQALAAWIAASLLLEGADAGRARGSAVLVAALTLLWSPFVTLGLLPLVAADLLASSGSFGRRLRDYISLPNAAGLLLGGLLGLFYATKLAPLLPILEGGLRRGFLPLEWGGADWPPFLALLAVSYLLEFGVLALLVLTAGLPATRARRWQLGAALLWLIVLPWFILGENNDLAMRASIPALFVLTLAAVESFCRALARRGLLLAAWVVYLALAAVAPLEEIAVRVVRIVQRGPTVDFALTQRYDLVERFLVDFELMQQYVSNPETPFFTLFGKALPPLGLDPQRPPYLFADRILLDDYYLDRTTIPPGGTATFYSTLRALRRAATNYSMAVRVVGPDGQVIWERQGWPANAATSQWEPSRRPWYDNRTIEIPAGTPPGVYGVQLYFADPATWDKLPVARLPAGSPAGTPDAPILPLTYLTVGDATQPPMSPDYPMSDPAQFGAAIELLGGNLPPAVTAAPGQTLDLGLSWRTLAPPATDYTTFIHVVDGGNRLVAQQDRPPLGGIVPTSLWRTGLVVPDEYQVPLPADLPAGRYRVLVGLYDGVTGARLPITQGEAPVGDSFLLAELTVP
jgi:hypothetical protein